MDTTSMLVSSLPRQTTSFIGRRREIADIIALLEHPNCQLLTLLGPGGIGKTRLAIEIARQIGARFAGGVHYVALQPLRSSDEILLAITHILSLTVRSTESAREQLLWYLADKHLLLLLDNFEHLPDGADLVANILTTAPSVKILVTSRETLNLREEWLWQVHGLSFPQNDATDSPDTYSAVQLFVERARQVRPGFTLDEARTPIVRLCQLVEGMPLALELAANWTKTLACDVIADEIQRDMDFLASRARNIPERHRSTRATFNHSWRLLFDEERNAFSQLAVFHGSFTHEAAEQVSGVSLAVLASLVDKSLVRQGDGGRYDIHELLRQYGEEHLETTEAAEGLKDSHAAYFAGLVARCEPGLKGSQQLQALNTMEADFDNIRAAWTRAAARRDFALLDRMIDSVWLYCISRGRVVEGQALFSLARTALAPAAGEEPHPVWGRVLARFPSAGPASIEEALALAQAHGHEPEIAFCLKERGYMYCQQRQFAHALSAVEDSLALYRRLGDQFDMLYALSNLTYISMTVGRWSASQDYLEQGMRIAQAIGSLTWQQLFLHYAGWSACFDGQYDRGEALLEQAEATGQLIGYRHLTADNRGALGYLAFLRGDLPKAREYIVEDLKVVTRVHAQGEQGFAKLLLAHIACVEEDYERARQLDEEALALIRPHPVRERFVARVGAMIACGVGDYVQARRQIHMVLSEETRPGIRLLTVPMVALLQAHEGLYDRAAALLGLLFTHPASAKGWLEQWPLISRLREDLEARLGADTFAADWEAGSQLDLDEVVEQALADTEAQADRQPLIEALTDRELDVLRLIAEGLSNRDIAERLTVVEGTVRTHVFNLCQKLDARNRTQAVARARALRIL